MTKKDYELIAGVLRRMRPGTLAFQAQAQQHRGAEQEWIAIRQEFTEQLACENSRFNRRKFEEACNG